MILVIKTLKFFFLSVLYNSIKKKQNAYTMAAKIKKRPIELPDDRNGTQLLLMQVLTLEQESEHR